MKYRSHSQSERRGLNRLAITLFSLFLPIIAATLFSGSFFRLGTLQAGELVDAGTAHAASGHASKGNAPSAVTVSIQNNSFVPNDITIDPGTAVTWVNNNGTEARLRDSE